MICKECNNSDTCHFIVKIFSMKNEECVIKPKKRFLDTLEQTFVEGCEDLKEKGEGSDEILNWYRNLYYKEDANTERRIVAEALNDILPELVKLRGAPSRKAARDKIRKTIIAMLKYEIVNTPSEFKGVHATPDFLNGVAHRQHEILDILKVMAGDTE